MSGLVVVALVLLAGYWLGRNVERQAWVTRRTTTSRATPRCPHCRARSGYQYIRVDRVEICAICRRCLRQVDRVQLR